MERQAYLQSKELSKSTSVKVFSTSDDKDLFKNHRAITFNNIKIKKGFAFKERLTWLIFWMYLTSKNKSDTCYVHQGHLLAFLIALYIRANPKIKLYIKIANSGFKFDLNLLNSRYKIPEKIINKIFTHKRISFLCLSGEIKSQLMGRGIHNQQLVEFRNGVKNDYTKNGLQDYSSRRTEFLFLGRLEKVKNLDFVVTCAKKHRNYNFSIIGDGNDKYRIQNLILENNIKNITIHGEIPQENINFNKYGWLILPSLAEGMSNVILEASANGLGIICHDIPANDFAKSINNFVITCSKFLDNGIDDTHIDFNMVQREEFKFFFIENVCNDLLEIIK